MQHKLSGGHLAALLTILIWGNTFISTKLLLEDFQPVEILFFRFLVGFAALWVVYPRMLKLRELRQEFVFMAAGFLGVCLYYLLENIALTYTLASNVSVILSVAPLFTAVLARLLLKGEEKKLSAKFFLGFLLALVGICMISFHGSELALNPAGDILAVLAAAVWAGYSLLTKKIGSFGYPVIAATRRTFFYGLLFMIPALFVFGFQPDISDLAKPANLFNFLYLGLGASALCFVTWNFAVKQIGAIRTSIYIYMVPVITVVSSALILKEPVTALAAAGTVLTLGGSVLSER